MLTSQVKRLKEIAEVLQNETYDEVEAIQYLLEEIMKKYEVRINLTDIAGISKINSRIDDIFKLYRYHNNPFCNRVKKNEPAFHFCVKSKNVLCNSFKKIRTPFYGKCYLGIYEFYYPVWFNEQLIALICIGQFYENLDYSMEIIRRKAKRYGLNSEACVEDYLSVTKEINFSVSDLNRDVWVLCNLLSLFYRNKILQRSIKSKLQGAVRSAADYYQNKAIISSALDFIKTNYAGKISLDLIAKHCYCSKAYLSHLFKKEMGITITEYINRCRVEHAKHLLDITDLTVAQIASEVGFTDPSYFSRVFKRVQGAYPTDYRKRT